MSLSVIAALAGMVLASVIIVAVRQFFVTGESQRHQLGLVAAIIVVVFCTTLLDEHHNYVSLWDVSLNDLLRQATMLSLISMGAAVVIITGGIDLSVGSVIAFSGSICATFMVLLAPDAVAQATPLGTGVIVTAICGTLLVGLLIGSLHAWLITEVGLPPFVATLGTLVGLRSLSRAIVENVTETILDGKRTQINIADRSFRELSGAISGTTWNLSILVAILALLLWGLLSRTVTGRHLYALGGNEQAARLSGIQTDRMKWLAYCISAFLSSLAGILSVSQLSVADPQTQARGYELNAIAAAVVGGCSLQGGVGTIPGTLLGAVFLRVVIDGVAKIIKVGADVYEGLIVGVLVVFAVTFTKSSTSQSLGNRRQFTGLLGWVTILNLTLLSAVMMALLGAKLLRGHLQMNSAWLAAISGVATLCILLIVRQHLSRKTQQVLGLTWAVATVGAVIGLDQAFPVVQRGSAVSLTRGLGGDVSQDEQGGLIVDLSGTRCGDVDLKQLLPRLKFFSKVSQIKLNQTPITDAGLDVIGKSFRESKSLSRLDLTGANVSERGVKKLKQMLTDLDVRN